MNYCSQTTALEQEKYKVSRTREEICHYETFNKEEFLIKKTYRTKALTVKKILKDKELLVYDKAWYEMIEIDVGACCQVGSGVLAKLAEIELKHLKLISFVASSFYEFADEVFAKDHLAEILADEEDRRVSKEKEQREFELSEIALYGKVRTYEDMSQGY